MDHLQRHGAGAQGLVTGQQDEGPTVRPAGLQGAQGWSEISEPDSTQQDTEGKTFRSLQAAFALRGHELLRDTAEAGSARYAATRWGLLKSLPCLADARTFLEQIGGKP